ncbi:MAG: DUF3817 domain-containing protein [Verrucomicrobiota bacterium]|nr:DUF3817 domain-containing protein [Verrucomicrobiota bacterium]
MHAIDRLRYVGMMEGISFLILVGVAMPLKYAFHYPAAVKYVGWAHGVLFILFCVVLLHTTFALRLRPRTYIAAFIASLIPFGPFLIDRSLRGLKSTSK